MSIEKTRNEVTGTIQGYLSGFFRGAVVGALVIVQFVMIIYLSFVLQEFTIYIYSFIQLLSIIIVIGLVNNDINASYKIGWICIIAAFPITGHFMFMLWGNKRSKKVHNKLLQKLSRGYEYLVYDQEVMSDLSIKYPNEYRISKYMEASHFPLTKNNKVDYFPMADLLFESVFEDIEAAENYVMISFYIVGDGVLWSRMHQLLQRKIRQGVRVLFLYDDFGAMLRTPKHFRRDLEAEGFEVRVFNPIHKYTDKLYMNYRSHQKIIVVDGIIGYTGGMNLADEYTNLVERFGVWKDNGVRVHGEAVWDLVVAFLQLWDMSSEAGQEAIYEDFMVKNIFEESDVYCQVISDGPANNPKNPIENIYKQMIQYAKKVLYITTPYLIIEDDMRENLIVAASSGIDVRIITPYIPDKKNVKYLTEYNYGPLLKAGVRIYEYLPGFIHSKTIISENSGIVGSINMDYRSFHLQYECGLWICNREVVDKIREDLLRTIEQCREITYEQWKSRPWYLKSYQRVLNLFSTLM